MKTKLFFLIVVLFALGGVERGNAQEFDSSLIVWKADFDYGFIEDCLVTNDNKFILVSTRNPAKLLVVDINDGAIVREFNNNDIIQIKLKMTPDSKKVVSLGGGAVNIWDYETGEPLNKLYPEDNQWYVFRDYDLYPDGSHIIIAEDNLYKMLYDQWSLLAVNLNTYETTEIKGGDWGHIESIKFSKDGKKILTGSRWWDDNEGQLDNAILWEYPEMIIIHGFGYNYLHKKSRVIYTPDNKYIILRDNKNFISFYNTSSFQKTKSLPYDGIGLNQTEITSDNKYLIFTYSAGIRIWDLLNERQTNFYPTHGSIGSSITLDDKFISVGIKHDLYLLKLETNPISVLDYSDKEGAIIVPNPTDGKTKITISPDISGLNDIRVYDEIGMEVLDLGSRFFSNEEYVIQYDFSSLPNGVYYLIISNRLNKYKNKFIVIK